LGERAGQDAPQVVAHVREVQLGLDHVEVGLEGRDLLAQDEQLLDEEQLAVHGARPLGHRARRHLRSSARPPLPRP